MRQRVNRAEWTEGGVHECQKTYYKNLFKEPFSQEFVLSLQPNYIIKKTMINRFVLNEVSYFGPGAR